MFRHFFQPKKQGQTPNPQEAEQAGFSEAPASEDIGLTMRRLMQKYPGTYVFSEQGRAEINRWTGQGQPR